MADATAPSALVPAATQPGPATAPAVSEDMRRRAMNVSLADITESLRDLALAGNMPPTEARVQKIAGSLAGIERALERIRGTVLAP